MDIKPAILRPKQAAQYIGVSVSSFWRFTKQDESFPKVFKVGVKTSAVMRDDLDRWIAARTGN